MNRCIVGAVLLGFVLCPVVAAQPEETDPEYEIALRERALELQRVENKVAAERRMQELELEAQRAKLEHFRKAHECRHSLKLLLLICMVVHLLVAIWVYQDIRQRGCGSGLWIVIALLAGLLGALVYAVVRLGDSSGGNNNKRRPRTNSAG